MMRIARLSVCAAAVVVSAACANSEAAKQRYFESGNRYLAEKKYQEAIVEYRNALQQDNKFAAARTKLAEAYVANGNGRAALREYVRVADLLPQDSGAQLKAATHLLFAGQFEDARTRARRVLDKEPKNVEAQIVFANSLAGLRDVDAAVREIEEAIQLDPRRGQTYSNLAILKLAQGQRDQAKAAFEKAVEIDDRSISAWLALANYQWSSGDVAQAEQSLKHAIAIEPKDVLSNRALAALYVGTGRARDAEPHLKVIAETSAEPESRLTLADYYLYLNRREEAVRILTSLAAERSMSDAAEMRLAAVDYEAGKTAQAHERLDRVLGREAANATGLILKARWLVAEGKKTEALEKARAAVAADHESVQAQYLLGTIQASVHQNAEAIASFNEVLRLNPRASAAQLQLSQLHLASGAPDAAVQFAEGALANSPGHPDARATLVRGLLARRDTAQAETEIASLLAQYPDASIAHSLQGALRLLKKDVPGARVSYERAIQLDPSSIEALAGLTRVDVLENRVPQARARLEARLAAAPNVPDLLLLTANVQAASRDFAKAEATLRHLIDVDPANPSGYAFLASIYLSERKLDEAKAEFDRAASRDPKNVSAQTMAAMIVHSQRNMVEAKKRYDQILKANPRAVVAANNLAWIYADEGQELDLALKLAQSAVQQVPDRAEMQDTLGWVYYRKELPLLAIRPFEQSIEKDPGNPTYHYHLALAFAKTGDTLQARRAAEKALTLKPDFPDAQRLLASLKG